MCLGKSKIKGKVNLISKLNYWQTILHDRLWFVIRVGNCDRQSTKTSITVATKGENITVSYQHRKL